MLVSLYSDTQVGSSVVETDQSAAGQIYEIPSVQQNGQRLPRSCVGGYQGMRPGPQVYSILYI